MLRRLIRRAVRQAFQLGVERPVTPDLVAPRSSRSWARAIPELARNADFITGVAAREEERFRATLRSGLAMLEAELAGGGGNVSGRLAFRLHDTHGFPIELTREIAAERGGRGRRGRLRGGHGRAAPAGQGGGERNGECRRRRRRARTGSCSSSSGPPSSSATPTSTADARVLGVFSSAGDGQVEIFLDATPFYAEGGGQVGDTGTIDTATGHGPGHRHHLGAARPLPPPGRDRRGHPPGQDGHGRHRRGAARRHPAQPHRDPPAALGAPRGARRPHVKQQGSLVAPDRLRFDFTHYGPVTADERARIEDLVNERVLARRAGHHYRHARAEADQAGAIAFFEEKYGDMVRVLQAGT